MAKAVVTDLLDAIVAELNLIKGDYTPVISPQRVYVPSYDRTKMTGVMACVGSTGVVTEPETRSENLHEYEVQVGILSPVKITETASIDDLILLVERLADHFRVNDRLTEYQDAVITGVQVQPIYDPEMLETKGVFVSVLVMTIQVIR